MVTTKEPGLHGTKVLGLKGSIPVVGVTGGAYTCMGRGGRSLAAVEKGPRRVPSPTNAGLDEAALVAQRDVSQKSGDVLVLSEEVAKVLQIDHAGGENLLAGRLRDAELREKGVELGFPPLDLADELGG